MSAAQSIAVQLGEMTGHYNRRLAFGAVLKASLGLVFSLLTFGFVYWFGWFLGFLIARYLSLQAWQFGLLFTAVFLTAATWSAWRNVNPLSGLQPLSQKERMVLLVSEAVDLGCFSPRHASAGAAVVLIAGPASVLHAVGIWTYRIRYDGSLIEEAASLLFACEERCPAMQVRQPNAALLLRRLGLIKVVSDGELAALTVTDKGFKLLSSAKGKAGMCSTKGDRAKSKGAERGAAADRPRE
jgi:hypothetical protein